MLTAETAREWLSYDPESGQLSWRKIKLGTRHRERGGMEATMARALFGEFARLNFGAGA